MNKIFVILVIFFIIPVISAKVIVEEYNQEKACIGTTLFADLYEKKIMEIDMDGNTVWEYILPEEVQKHLDPGFDVELLPNKNIMYTAPGYGIFEIDRNGTIVWEYLSKKVSHDADLLENNNILFGFGYKDTLEDYQAVEITRNGTIVWQWSAGDYFNYPPYSTIAREGWTHTNAVSRLENNDTLISLRNFNTIIEVNTTGDIVWTYDWSKYGEAQHDPVVLPDNHILIAVHGKVPAQVIEIDKETGELIWKYGLHNLRRVRDANRLPNGNTIIDGDIDQYSYIIEVTPNGEIVWKLKEEQLLPDQYPGWFFKAERICTPQESISSDEQCNGFFGKIWCWIKDIF